MKSHAYVYHIFTCVVKNEVSKLDTGFDNIPSHQGRKVMKLDCA